MKKSVFCLFLVMTLLLGSLSLGACTKGIPQAPEGTVTRVTLQINPGVELMVDDQNKVLSVTGLNDDAAILLVGEDLVGKTPEEATEHLLRLAVEMGYLAADEKGESNVQISVSGDSRYAEALEVRISDRLTEAMESLDLEGKVEACEALGMDALRALALSTALVSEEEANAMSAEELYRVIAAGRVETAALLTVEMREAYYAAKEHRIAFAQREATAKVIQAMGGVYTLVHAGYQTALSLYQEAINSLEELRYQILLSPDSQYQKNLAALRDAKVELLQQRSYVATMKVNGEDCGTAEATLQLREKEYEAALAAYEKMGETANAAMDALLQTLRACEERLVALEESFSDDIHAELTAKAAEMEAAVNAAKDSFFAAFEAEHMEDLQAMEEALLQRKQSLLASAKGEE